MSSDRPPNILFVFSDQHRWDWIGNEGVVPVRTPNLDKLAQRGVQFHQCRVNNPMCAPSRAALATGLRSHRTGVPKNQHEIDPSMPTFMKALRNEGYQVLSCGKSDLHQKSRLHGIDGWSTRMGQLGFTMSIDTIGKRGGHAAHYPIPREPYMAYMHAQGLAKAAVDDDQARKEQVASGGGQSADPCPFERKHQMDDFTGRSALKLLNDAPRESPWFLQVFMPGPHAPFDACEELLARYEGVEFPDPVAPKPASEDPTDHQAIRRNYAAMIEGIDDWMGWLIEAVERRGELDNTIVIYSSDHGEGLADLGRWNKGFPADPSVRVPLIMAGPGIQQGVSSQALVELIDLAATFTDYAHAQPIPDADAKSLRPVLEGQAENHRPYTASMYATNWRMVTDGRWKYVEWQNGRDTELFDLEADPFEQENVAAAQPEQMARLKPMLAEAFGTG